MNPRTRSSGSPGSMHDRLSEWRRLVERCGEKPSRKRVHALRVITLRLQAELEIDLGELPRASHQAQAILAFQRQGERLRKALGPVREMDVWIGKLQGLQKALAESSAYVPRSTRECLRQIRRLEEQLKERRSRSEKKLVAVIARRKPACEEAAREIDRSLHVHANEPDEETEKMIRLRFAEVARDFPQFDEDNLHDFRKRIKMVRYLAEIHAADRGCAQIATQMKKLQSAIGEWHDWQALRLLVEEKRRLRDVGELLQSLAAESLGTAIATCHGVIHKLAGERETSESSRKPPASEGLGLRAERGLA